MAAVSRNKIIIVLLGGLGVALAVFLAVTLNNKKPLDLPPPANEGAENATNNPAPIRTNAPAVPSTNSPPVTPPTPTGDPLLRALQQKGTLKAVLESLAVDHSFDTEGNLLWLGFGSFAVTEGTDWIFHEHYAWLFVFPEESGGLWYWQKNLGWLWTSRDLYPYVFQQGAGWHYFLGGATGKVFLFRYSDGRWIDVVQDTVR